MKILVMMLFSIAAFGNTSNTETCNNIAKNLNTRIAYAQQAARVVETNMEEIAEVNKDTELQMTVYAMMVLNGRIEKSKLAIEVIDQDLELYRENCNKGGIYDEAIVKAIKISSSVSTEIEIYDKKLLKKLKSLGDN